jgi:hypothetical protein
MRRWFSISTGFIGSLCCLVLHAQSPEIASSGDIYKSIQKLRVLGSVLYVAAHPDDENTRLISHFSNDLNLHTTYLSMTRGDGGQNLIGPEISELLGVIRTHELLEARAIDNGHQRFTRANDFGYSKTPEETLEIWNEEEILPFGFYSLILSLIDLWPHRRMAITAITHRRRSLHPGLSI